MLVDDHPVVREGLRAVLEDQSDFAVVGEAGAAEEALAIARRLRPDVILLDLELPDADGVQALPRLLEAAPDARVLVFTAYSTDERVFGAIRAGARGYLLKGAAAEEIGRGIRAIHAGGSHLEPQIAARVLSHVGGFDGRPQPALTERECQVLRLLAQGQANKRIARTIGITERTAKFHVASIMRKLGAENRTQVVSTALQRRLL